MVRVDRAPLSRVLFLALCAATACGKKDDPQTSTSAAQPGDPKVAGDGSPATPAFDRIVARKMPAVEAKDGLVDGAMIQAAVRIGAATPWLRSIPLPGDVARDLAQFSDDSGVDWRAENLERRFALAPDAVMTMSLLRPIDTGLADLRGELERGGIVLDAMTAVLNAGSGIDKPIEAAMPAEAPPVMRAEVTPVPPVAPEIKGPIEVVPPPDPIPTPPPISDADRERGRQLAEIASSIGFHSRFAVPVTDPRPIVDHFRTRVPGTATSRWAEICTTVAGALCFGDDEVVVVVRGGEHLVTFDVILFARSPRDVTAAQRTAIIDAVRMTTSTTDHGLRGDASAVFDARVVVRFAEMDAVRRTVSSVGYGDRENLRRDLDGASAFVALASAPQLFRGARIDGVVEGEDLHVEGRWLLVPGQADAVTTAFAVAPPTAKVPSLAALCDGSLMCFRTAGLPRPSTLADRLGVGPWAAGPDAVERSLNSSDEPFFVHVLLASWPNFLGSIARLPEIELGRGPEASIARNVVDMIGRIEGTGGSLRSASFGPTRGSGDFVVYARASATDAAVPRAMLSLAGQTMTDVTLPGGAGAANSFTLPEDEFPATLMTRVDPAEGAKAAAAGWITLVDGADRLTWLLAQPAESYGGPGIYAEIPDLGRLVATIPELARELAPVSGFLERRSLRASIDLDAGEPRLRASLVRTKG